MDATKGPLLLSKFKNTATVCGLKTNTNIARIKTDGMPLFCRRLSTQLGVQVTVNSSPATPVSTSRESANTWVAIAQSHVPVNVEEISTTTGALLGDLGVFGTLVALGSLVILGALGTLVALGSLVILGALGALGALVALGSLVILGTLGALGAFVNVGALVALRASNACEAFS